MASKILITGNMGYVGPAVVRQLRSTRTDAYLMGLDVGYFAHCLTGAHCLPEKTLDEQRFMDIRDVTAQDLQGVDAIVNLAAISNDPMGKSYEEPTLAINHQAAVQLAKLAKTQGVSAFVFASSCSVYGAAEEGARTEQDPVNPLTAYARSKIDTENDLVAVADDTFKVTCLRFPTACGMSDRLRLDLVLNDFAACAHATGKIEILSDGKPWRPLIDTADMALAIDWAIDRDAQEGGNFLAINVGRNECNYQVWQLAEAVAAQCSGVEISINENAAPDKRSYQVDFGLYAQLAPNHLPRMTLEDSVRGLLSGLRTMNFSDSNFRETDYMRLRVLNGFREHQALNADLRWA